MSITFHILLGDIVGSIKPANNFCSLIRAFCQSRLNVHLTRFKNFRYNNDAHDDKHVNKVY